MGPELAVADGALGFWQAVEEVWPKTRGQRCWVQILLQKSANGRLGGPRLSFDASASGCPM
jgi:hypothetical protein